MINFSIDLHTHPAMKPFGHSFHTDHPGANNPSRRGRNSLWYYDPPSLTDKILNYIGGLTKFSQANCSSLSYGNVRIACASLYPLEKWFVNNKLGTGDVADVIEDFALGIGKNRIDRVQAFTEYFSDLELEYDFYRQLDGQEIKIEGGKYRYVLAKSYADIENKVLVASVAGGEPGDSHTICFVMSIEGMHVLNTGLENEPDEQEVLANLQKIKKWEHRPFFVTFAHHFWNHLSGHSESLSGIVARVADQSKGKGLGFTALGWKVLDGLLDNSDNKRILIDVKHMSPMARSEYYQHLIANYAGESIPLIISHGAANGRRSRLDPVMDMPDTAHKLLDAEINFYDDELLMMARTNGIIGLQLDERRIASKSTLSSTKHSMFRNKIMHYRSELMWNQVQHIAELLDKHGLFAWNNIALGSDFDGIIDPLNSFWTTEEMPFLADYLERHAHNYMEGRGKLVLKSYNQLQPHEIITRVFRDNALEFFRKWFK